MLKASLTSKTKGGGAIGAKAKLGRGKCPMPPPPPHGAATAYFVIAEP